MKVKKSSTKKIKTKSKFIQELASTKPVEKPSKKPKANHYVNNQQFLECIIKYRAQIKANKKAKLPKPKIPDIIGKQLYLIAVNLSHKPNFNAYTFRDEMVGDAIENCIMYFDNFDPKKSKYPFTYFTKIIYYAFVRRIQREKKHLYIKYKATQQANILHDAETAGEDGEHGQQIELYDNINEFITRYEDAQDIAKIRSRKPVKKGLELLVDSED